MTDQVINLPAYYINFNVRADGSVKLSFETQEVTDDEIRKILWDLKGAYGALAFVANAEAMPTLPQAPKSNPKESLSPSQLVRFRLLKIWELKKPGMEFDEFYKYRMKVFLQGLDEELAMLR